MLSQAEIRRQQTIQSFRQQHFENQVGNTGQFVPKEDKVVEWALMEIVEMLRAIHYQLIMLNAPKPGGR